MPGEVDADKFDGLHPGFLDLVKTLHAEVYGPEYWRHFLELTSHLWLTVPTYSDEVLGRIPVPTLVVAGDRDGAAIEQAPGFVRALPDSEPAVIPGADHAAVDRPLFREIVRDFADRRRGGA